MIFVNTGESSQLRIGYNAKLKNEPSVDIPFIGRKVETESIHRFCQEVLRHDTASVLWISGEAGIGKSCLLKSVAREIEQSGTIVLHVQFYEYGCLSSITLLRHLLSAQHDLQSLFNAPIKETASSVILAIRRLIRLRPTVLILEDVHLLSKDSVTELSSLVAAISHEPVSILCAARPQECPSNSALLPWITASMELLPFSPEEVAELLAGCGTKQPKRIVERIHQATRGIPLILRSVLLELLQTLREGIKFPAADGAWETRVQERIKATLRSISIGIDHGIIEDERLAFERLALLGEIFSREAAHTVIDNADRIIEEGISAGVIIPKRIHLPPLLGQRSSDYPLSFGHSLLHELLLDTARGLSVHDMLKLLESNTALYSTRVIYRIVSSQDDTSQTNDTVSLLPQLIHALCERSRHLVGIDVGLANATLKPIKELYFTSKHLLSLEEQSRCHLDILQSHLISLRLKLYSDEMLEVLDQYLHLTATPDTEEIAIHRCIALSWHAHFLANRLEQSETATWSLLNVFNESFELAEQFSGLVSTSHFANLLSTISPLIETTHEQRVQLRSMLYQILEKAQEADVRQIAYFRFAPNLLLTPTSKDFIEEGIIIINQGIQEFSSEESYDTTYMTILPRLITIGETEQAISLIERYIAKPLRGKSLETEIIFRCMEGLLAASVGLPLEYVEELFRQLIQELPKHLHGVHSKSSLYEYICVAINTIGLLNGDIKWAEGLSNELSGKNIPQYRKLETALIANDTTAIEEAIKAGHGPDRLRQLAAFSMSSNQEFPTELAHNIQVYLRNKPFTQACIARLNIVALLFERMTEKNVPEKIKKDLSNAIEQGLKWCEAKHYSGITEQLIERGRRYWPSSNIKAWKERFRQTRNATLQNWGSHQQLSVLSKRSLITMTEEITVRYGELPPQNVPGTRVQQTLGLIVAHEQMRYPLTLETFRELATGMEADPLGSANYLRIIISRLRGILGKDSIVSNGKNPPHLNPHCIRVDLLEASMHIDNCMNAIRTLHPRKAKQEVLNALEKIGHRRLYPTLEGDFFDAARRDFEIRIRNAILSASHLFCQEKDYEEAADLLLKATCYMPEDEEIAEKLVDQLQMLGRNTDAFGVARQANR